MGTAADALFQMHQMVRAHCPRCRLEFAPKVREVDPSCISSCEQTTSVEQTEPEGLSEELKQILRISTPQTVDVGGPCAQRLRSLLFSRCELGDARRKEIEALYAAD